MRIFIINLPSLFLITNSYPFTSVSLPSVNVTVYFVLLVVYILKIYYRDHFCIISLILLHICYVFQCFLLFIFIILCNTFVTVTWLLKTT